MEENKIITAKESKKIDEMMKRIIRQTDKMLRQHKGYSSFAGVRSYQQPA